MTLLADIAIAHDYDAMVDHAAPTTAPVAVHHESSHCWGAGEEMCVSWTVQVRWVVALLC